MFNFVIGIHMFVCALLILVVLIQQGRGGGLIDSMSSAESLFGTKTNTLLVRSTSVLAVLFFVTCLTLAFMSIQKNKSLVETRYQPQAAAAATTSAGSASTDTKTATPPTAPVAPTPTTPTATAASTAAPVAAPAAAATTPTAPVAPTAPTQSVTPTPDGTPTTPK